MVIPKDIRDRLGIAPGDEVIFVEDADGVHVMRAMSLRELRGLCKGGPPMAEWWDAYKAEELALEDKHFGAA